MKIFKFTLIAISLLLIGCGSGSSKSNTSELTSIKTIDDAKSSYKALNSFETINNINSGYNNFSQKIQKIQKVNSVSEKCVYGGNINFYTSEDQKSIEISYEQCKDMNEVYINGTIKMYYEDENHGMITFSNYTEKDIDKEEYLDIVMKWNEDNNIEKTEINGIIKQTSKEDGINNISFKNMIITEKDTYNESWININGGIGLESKCTTGNYQFKTIEKLVEAKDGTENTESGILNINGATYTFNNPYVTIKTSTEEKTLLQSELEKEMESSNSCK